MGAVAGAVPTGFERIPMQMTADMRATGRSGEELAAIVAIGCDLRKSLTNDGAAAGLEIVERRQLAGSKILRKVLYRRDVLLQKVSDSRGCLARRFVDLFPFRRLTRDQRCVE